MNNKPPRGKFIVLEGPDGCGKTTNAPYLTEKLRSLGMTVVHTREVGSTPLGQQIRAVCYADIAEEKLDPIARLMLIYAARIQNLRCIVEPALARGEIVVCDRFNDSTYIYQGKEDKLQFVIGDFENIDEMKYVGQRPDHLLYFKISGATSIARGKSRGAVDNTQYKGDEERAHRICDNYHKRMLDMARKHPNKPIHWIDAEDHLEKVQLYLDNFALQIQKEMLCNSQPGLKAA